MSPKATPAPGKSLLSPTDHALILIDHQSRGIGLQYAKTMFGASEGGH
jgi:hypothetical protein